MALGPGEVDNQLIIVTGAGEMKFIDFRMTTGQASASVAGEGFPPFNSSSARMGVWKTVAPDDKGPVCAVAAHPYAPLLATSSLAPQSQVRSPGHLLTRSLAQLVLLQNVVHALASPCHVCGLGQ